jgi:hypothetical protein
MKQPKQRDERPKKEKRRPVDDRLEGEHRECDPFDVGQGREDRPSEAPTRAKLFVPYYVGDIGDRSQPFPPEVLSWWCPGLRITRPDGTPYLGGTLERGQTSKVTVDVANGGTASAWAQVSLYWADPSLGFGPPYLRRKPELGSPRMMHVGPGMIEQSPAIDLTPVASTPDHMCLVAVVSAFDDPPSETWDPLTDRHYAQHNLDLVQTDEGGVGAFSFYVTNPLHEAAAISVRIRPVELEALRALSRVYGAEGRELSPGALGLTQVERGQMDRPAPELQLELDAGERRLCQGLVAGTGLRRGEISAVTVEMTARPARGERGRKAHGSFGAVVFVNG